MVKCKFNRVGGVYHCHYLVCLLAQVLPDSQRHGGKAEAGALHVADHGPGVLLLACQPPTM